MLYRWKGKEKSGILRLEVSLFSGYELHSVNPVVLDGPVHADLHYGSRGESVWFVFANVSVTKDKSFLRISILNIRIFSRTTCLIYHCV